MSEVEKFGNKIEVMPSGVEKPTKEMDSTNSKVEARAEEPNAKVRVAPKLQAIKNLSKKGR